MELQSYTLNAALFGELGTALAPGEIQDATRSARSILDGTRLVQPCIVDIHDGTRHVQPSNQRTDR